MTLKGRNQWLSGDAARLLAKVAGDNGEICDFLLDLIEDGTLQDYVAWDVIKTLGLNSERVERMLAGFIHSGQESARVGALRCLSELAPDGVLRRLSEFLASEDMGHKRVALQYLVDRNVPDTFALSAYAAAVHERSPDLRVLGFRGLFRTGAYSDSGVGREIAGALVDDDDVVRVEVAKELERVESSRELLAEEVLRILPLLSGEVLAAAYSLLAKLEKRSHELTALTAVLTQGIREGSASIVAAIMDGIRGEAGGLEPQLMNAVRARLQDTDVKIRSAAIRWCEKTLDDAPETRRQISEGLFSGDEDVEYWAFQYFETLGFDEELADRLLEIALGFEPTDSPRVSEKFAAEMGRVAARKDHILALVSG